MEAAPTIGRNKLRCSSFDGETKVRKELGISAIEPVLAGSYSSDAITDERKVIAVDDE